MKKLFLYIDESKDYKNNTLYVWGLASYLGFHLMNEYCAGLLPSWVHYELKSTRLRDREFFEKIIAKEVPFSLLGNVYEVESDQKYEKCLCDLIIQMIWKHENINVFVDSIKIAGDMRKYQKMLSKKLSRELNKNIQIEFKKSSEYRCIQFADLAIGVFRRKNMHKKVPLVDVS